MWLAVIIYGSNAKQYSVCQAAFLYPIRPSCAGTRPSRHSIPGWSCPPMSTPASPRPATTRYARSSPCAPEAYARASRPAPGVFRFLLSHWIASFSPYPHDRLGACHSASPCSQFSHKFGRRFRIPTLHLACFDNHHSDSRVRSAFRLSLMPMNPGLSSSSSAV